MEFPKTRLRRLRSSKAMRDLVRQTSLNITDLIYPLFVKTGSGVKEPIEAMTGCYHFSPDTIVTEAAEVVELGIPAILLFGHAANKDETGSEAWVDSGAVQLAIKNIKQKFPDLLVITDVCLCAYTLSGHCGVVKGEKIDNDPTCQLLAKVALSHAQAGADMVAPSDMMDGRVKYIREALDENAFSDVPIMAYSAKYASVFYGPFRDVADSAPSFGDRKTYQMDPAGSCDDAIREIEQDLAEGADIVMVKPALAFLDIIARAKASFDCPIAAYNVSGEYMMINAAAKANVFDRTQAMMEVLYSFKRAGADIIITYFAKDAAKVLR